MVMDISMVSLVDHSSIQIQNDVCERGGGGGVP